MCLSITELENREKLKNDIDIHKNRNFSLQNRLVKLIGDKPIFECLLNGSMSRVLWDTGSMISMVDEAWVEKNASGAELRPISDFLNNDEKVEFLAANNTQVPMVGSIVLEFTMGENTFPVPFLVTSTKILHPILGFNVIEYLISSGNRESVIDSLLKANRDITVGKVNIMVNLIETKLKDNDILGELRAAKSCVIPAKCIVKIRCKVKGDVKGLDLSFVCSSPVAGDWDGSLEVMEALGELKRGRTPHVNIEIRNVTGIDKLIQRNMILGEMFAVNAVMTIRLFNHESSYK